MNWTWDSSNSNPIQDLVNAAKHYPLYHYVVDKAGNSFPTTFNGDIPSAVAADGTVDTDDDGRPLLNESGGMVKRQKRYCHVGHGELASGGWCKRCR